MVIPERLYTADDLLLLPHDDRRYELVEGRLIEMSPTGETYGLLTAEIATLIRVFVRDHKLGRVYGAETGFKLTENPDTVYGIDVAFVSKARLKPVTEGFINGAPDLAVEVVSPGNTTTEMHAKIKAYFEAGAKMVWVFFPKSRTVYAYRGEDKVLILHEKDVLGGGEVLPGFSVKIADIFAVLDE